MANAKSAKESDRPEEDDDDLHWQTLVWNHTLSVVDSMVLKCAVKLRLFDAIHRRGGDRPISLPELAEVLPVPHHRLPFLHRLMRYLAHLRLVSAHPGESYALTRPAAAYLREASEKSHAPFLRLFVEEDMIEPLYALDAFLAGDGGACSSALDMVRGENFFEWATRDPALSKRFNDGMLCTVLPTIEAVLRDCPEVFDGVDVLVDVGGGEGAVAAAIAGKFSSIRCIVYDLPHVVMDAPKSGAVEYEGGDMTVYVPHADALLLTRVLHDCSDERALQILCHCRQAVVGEKGKVIIIDIVINETDSEELNHVKLCYDMLMMTYCGGKERTEKDWRSLLLKAGFTRCSVKPIKSLQYVIEAHP